jgi:hypothetical protein
MFLSGRIPDGMWRPPCAREALGFSPLLQARRADAPRVEGIPFVAAGAKPFVFLAGRPTAKRAADARAGRVWALFLIGLAIQDAGGFVGVVREGAHDPIL